MSSLPLSIEVIAGRGTLTVDRDVIVVAPAAPSPARLEPVVRKAELGLVAPADLRGVCDLAPATAVAARCENGWAVAVGPEMLVEADHVGHRVNTVGPFEGVLADIVRFVLRPADTPRSAPAAMWPAGSAVAGTRSGAGAILHTAVVLGHRDVDVDGVVCSCGAFLHPLSVVCAACHQVLPVPRALRRQPAVPVGRLVFDDGRALPLAGPLVLGREPAVDPEMPFEDAELVVLTDSQRSVSRVHAVISIRGWDVLLSDQGSSNGTAVRPPTSAAWTVLLPGTPVRLLPGTELRLGRRHLRLVA